MNDRDPSLRDPRPVRRAVRHPDQLKNAQPAQPARQTPQPPVRQTPQQQSARQTPQAQPRRAVPTGAPQKKKKKRSPFYIILFSVLFVLFIALFVGLMVLRSVLAAYEEAQPIHQAEKVFEEYFAARDFEKVVAAAGVTAGEYETPTEIAALMSATAKDKELIYYPVASTEEEARYAVAVVSELPGDEISTDPLAVRTIRPEAKLATMIFTRNAEEGKYGFRGYTFKEITLELSGRKKFTARIPAAYSLFVNGKEVPKEEHTGETASPLNDFLDEGVPGLFFYEYSVKGLYLEPVLSCADAAGNKVELVETDGVYGAWVVYSEELKAAHSEFVLAGIRAYMSRMSNDGGLGAVVKYFDVSSEYYAQIRDNPSVFVWDHNGNSFAEQTAEDFYAFDAEHFCCRVKMVQHLHMRGREDYVEYFDEILFIHKCSDGSWGIYDHVKPEVVEHV